MGPRRNCGLSSREDGIRCTPGTKVTLSCTTPSGSAPQVVRVCEHSEALKSGIACTYQDSFGSMNVEPEGATMTFDCPAPRGPGEPGAAYSLYTGATITTDAEAPVTCTATEAPAVCPFGDGLYCGSAETHRSRSTLFRCRAGVYSVERFCPRGCRTARQGENDECY
jgi:hypothetical protein